MKEEKGREGKEKGGRKILQNHRQINSGEVERGGDGKTF
jgi:hypothetical protein